MLKSKKSSGIFELAIKPFKGERFQLYSMNASVEPWFRSVDET